jgi:putative membrane-bound dehydrogenase-like protein
LAPAPFSRQLGGMTRHWLWLVVLLLTHALLAAADEAPSDTATMPSLGTNEPGAPDLQTNNVEPASGDAMSPVQAAPPPAGMRLRTGIRMQLAAAEPDVVNPVAIAFDADGNLFVAEGGVGGQAGRIKRLQDADGDGRFEKVVVFGDNIPSPTALVCYGAGAFVASGHQILFLADTSGDGKADVRNTTFTSLGSEDAAGVPRITHLIWGLDNRIHAACNGLISNLTCVAIPNLEPVTVNGRDFSFNPRTLEVRMEAGGDSLGLGFDNAGRRYTTTARQAVLFTVADPLRTSRNPLHHWPELTANLAGPGWRVFPLKPARTSAEASGNPLSSQFETNRYARPSSLLVYRGMGFPTLFTEALFVTDPELRIISQWELTGSGIVPQLRRPTAIRGSEFLASRDPAFRPVQIIAAPDGSLCIADLNRTNLNTPDARGRIWRIVPTGHNPVRPTRLSVLPTISQIKLLESGNGWVRDTAGRLIFERNERENYRTAAKEFRWNWNPVTKLHALNLLAAGDLLEEMQLIRAFQDKDATVRETAAALTAEFIKDNTLSPTLMGQLAVASRDVSPRVRFQAVLTLGGVDHSAMPVLLASAIQPMPTDPWMQSAVLTSAHSGAAAGVLSRLCADERIYRNPGGWAFLRTLARMAGTQEYLAVDELVGSFNNSGMGLANMLVLACDVGDGLYATGRTFVGGASTNESRALGRRALEVAISGNTAALRADAIRFLGVSGYSMREAGDWILAMLVPGEFEAVQLAAVDALAHFPDPQITTSFVQRWQRLPGRVQGQIIARMLEQFDRTHALMDALESGAIARNALTDVQVNVLRNHRDQNIAARALRLFGPTPKSDFVARHPAILKLKGSSISGLRIFEQRCAGCHTYQGVGQSFGPDLAHVYGRSREELLSDILDPSEKITAGYQTHVVQRTSNQLLLGLISKPGGNFLRIDQPNDGAVFIPESQVEDKFPQDWSLMPADAAAGLTLPALADLLSLFGSESADK